MAGFHERTHRLPGFNIFRCFEVLSGFRRLPGLRNPWKLICSITDVGTVKGIRCKYLEVEVFLPQVEFDVFIKIKVVVTWPAWRSLRYSNNRLGGPS